MFFPSIKSKLHPRNKNNSRYDFDLLCEDSPELKPFVRLNKHQNLSIDFFNPLAVKALNKSLLKTHYQLDYWDIPKGFLCPPIPGRADYIHHLSDLLTEEGFPKGSEPISVLDIGVGANCIYPIIGIHEYHWSFVATDINEEALENAQKIEQKNPSLKGKIEFRKQKDSQFIFKGILKKNDSFTVSICNPPFHSSAQEAQKSNRRKTNNLSSKKNKNKKQRLNFGGQNTELWCQGGELTFIQKLIKESSEVKNNCIWFSSLVAKKEHLTLLYKALEKVDPSQVRTINMGQGNKISRILAWRF